MTLDDALDGDDDATYWPGYVDALTNIVLNLLFMVGVFAVGVFAVSLESSIHRARNARSAEAASASSATAAVRPAPAERVPARLAPLAVNTTPAAPVRATVTPQAGQKPGPAPFASRSEAAASAPPSEASKPEPASGATIVRLPAAPDNLTANPAQRSVQMKFTDSRGNPLAQIVFPGDRFSLVTSEEARLANWVREQQAAGTRTYMLFTSVDESDAQDRRAGYLRIMAARAALIDAGIAASSITTRMFRGEQREVAGNRQITIIPNPREN